MNNHSTQRVISPLLDNANTKSNYLLGKNKCSLWACLYIDLYTNLLINIS
jgi:hypothetical protein